jgi:hypothetical protein
MNVTLGTLRKEPTKPQEIEHSPRLRQLYGTHYLPVLELRIVYLILKTLKTYLFKLAYEQ